MIEKIKNAVFAKFKKEDCKGVFLSVFDENNRLLMSSGAFYTDKVIDSLLDTLYHGLVEKYKNISFIVVDVITDEEEVTDVSKINEISLQEYGIAVIAGDKYGVMLPNTAGVANTIQAIQLIKQKDNLEGNAKIVKFHTDRLLVQ